MTAKPFAVGVRIEHPQTLINQAQYKEFAEHPRLGAAEYRLTHKASSGRGVYTFCMCLEDLSCLLHRKKVAW